MLVKLISIFILFSLIPNSSQYIISIIKEFNLNNPHLIGSVEVNEIDFIKLLSKDDHFQNIHPKIEEFYFNKDVTMNAIVFLNFQRNQSESYYLELPKNSFTREYKVKIKGNIDKQKLRNLENGIKIKGIKYKSIKTSILEKNKDTAIIKMKLVEGKNREIRKIMSFFKYFVIKLQRISYGPIQLKNLKKNEIKEINVNKYFKKIK